MGYWTHETAGSLPLAQLERPIPWASPRRATSIHTFQEDFLRSIVKEVIAMPLFRPTMFLLSFFLIPCPSLFSFPVRLWKKRNVLRHRLHNHHRRGQTPTSVASLRLNTNNITPTSTTTSGEESSEVGEVLTSESWIPEEEEEEEEAIHSEAE